MAFKRRKGRRFFDAPALDFQHLSPNRSAAMTLVSIPANPVPEDVVSGMIKRQTARNCASRAGRRRRAARARSASSPAAPSRSKNISRRYAICAIAVSRWR